MLPVVARAADNLPYRSVVPLHQRRQGSVYAALRTGKLDERQFSGVLVRHPLNHGQPVFAVDVTVINPLGCGDQPRAGLLLPLFAPLGGQARRGRLGSLPRRPGRNRAIVVDGTCGRDPARAPASASRPSYPRGTQPHQYVVRFIFGVLACVVPAPLRRASDSTRYRAQSDPVRRIATPHVFATVVNESAPSSELRAGRSRIRVREVTHRPIRLAVFHAGGRTRRSKKLSRCQ
jgi:hypothetical protein